MEAAVVRGGTISAALPLPPPGKEWRVTEVQERPGALDMDFCSIAIDSEGLSDELLQQRIHTLSRQREELQDLEIALKVRAIARSEIIEMQKSFDLQIKEHADAAARLKEQLQERDQCICDLELKLDEKDRELCALQRDNEAAWAKEEATLRRERDNSETERAQHLQQIHDLQERIREQEKQCVAFQEQCRAAQDSIVYKDEQLREAQTWIARVQEMGTVQTTTNQSLQAELREHIEQFNQYYIGFQRQFMEMERHHLQAIQQLQMELAEERERNGVSSESSQGAHGKSVDTSTQGNKANQSNLCFSSTLNGNSGCDSNGSSDGVASFISSANPFAKIEHASSMSVLPPSILGIGSFIPPGQVTSLHPYIIQPQTVQQCVPSMNSPIAQSHVGHGLQVPQVHVQQDWQSQQGMFDASQMPLDNMNQLSQTEQNMFRSDAHYGYEGPMKRHAASDQINNTINQQISDPVMNGTNEKFQGFESNGTNFLVQQESQEKLTTHLRFHDKLAFDKPSEKSEIADENIASRKQSEKHRLPFGQQWSGSDATVSASEISSINSDNSSDHNVNISRENDIFVSVSGVSSLVKPGKALEPCLLDERGILACIVRAIPAGPGNGIRISTTLTNRLAKMLAPLHWQDYKRRYGKLDEFVGRHQELFVTDGDVIRLREGAHEIIAATTAVAKVAAAASSATYASLLPSVAVTPVAHMCRHNIAPSADSRARNAVQHIEASATSAGDLTGMFPQTSKLTTHLNSVNFNIVQGMCDIKIMNKTRDDHEANYVHEANSLSTEIRPSHAPLHVTSGNGPKLDGAGAVSSDGKDISSERQVFGGRRSAAAGAISRRS